MPSQATPRRAQPALALALALALAACGNGDNGSATTTAGATVTSDDSTVGATTQTTQATHATTASGPTTAGSDATTTGSSSGDAGTDCPFVCEDDAPAPSPECDLFLQNCPQGQKCIPVAIGGPAWDHAICSDVDAEPVAIGEPCTAAGAGFDYVDDCPHGAICFFLDGSSPGEATGECVPLCTGSTENPTCEDGYVCPIVGNGYALACVPRCDPLASDCPARARCDTNPWGDGFVCSGALAEPEGPLGPCEWGYECADGLVCADGAELPGCVESGCCTPFCELNDPVTCDAVPGTICAPWFDPPDPDFLDVGVCISPP